MVYLTIYKWVVPAITYVYRIVGKFGGGKFGEFDESSMIRQAKIIQIN